MEITAEVESGNENETLSGEHSREERSRRRLTKVVTCYLRDASDALEPSIHVACVSHVEEATHSGSGGGI